MAANPYHYAANDPLRLFDPLGLRPLSMAEYQQIREQRQTGLVDHAGQVIGDVTKAVGEGIVTGLRYAAGGALTVVGFVGSFPVIGAPVHLLGRRRATRSMNPTTYQHTRGRR